MDLRLQGTKALVGGASKGLGKAVARALLQEGAEVMIAARHMETLTQAAEELAEQTGHRPLFFPADLTQAKDRQELARQAQQKLGAVDILVANAGGPPTGPFASHGPEHWKLAWDLSLGAFTHLVSLLLPGMKQRGFGRIVQLVSIAGLESIEGLILSNALRPAVLGFGKALAREVASNNILINSLCPGIFLTDRVREIIRQQSKQLGISEEEALHRLAGDIPLGRPGQPEELGDIAAFLCSPRNTYITGAALVVDGGKTRRLF